MTNRLFFNAREWNFNKACDKNVGERCFINGIDGKLVEVYTIGNWQWDWTEIISKPMMLEKNTDYNFCFWLNGGENDRNCEVCQFRVVFDGDHENSLIFKLNRGYIKPLKRYNGWELYDITFKTGDNDLTQLKFVAQSAYMAVQPAKEPDVYDDLSEVLDEFHDMRPQRHNIVFEDGWPANNWYSTKELRKKREAERNGTNHNFGERFGPGQSMFGMNRDWKNGHRGNGSEAEDASFRMVGEIPKQLKTNILEDIDIIDIVNEIKDDIDIDDIIEDIKDSIDLKALREEIKQELINQFK